MSAPETYTHPVRTEAMDTTALKQEFKRVYDAEPCGIAIAPGRVNLIGEHTDYNGGFVLPCALGFSTKVAYRPRRDNLVRVRSLNYNNQEITFSLDKPLTPIECHWANYIIGVYYSFIKMGYSVKGADLLVWGNVPQGAGLSSSAALEVSVACAINTQEDLRITPTDIALIGQFTENSFLGCQTGIMDQMISANAKAGHALLLDCEDLSVRHIPVPKDFQLLVVDSNFKRTLVGSEYNQRRKECEAAAALDVPSLRHASMDELVAGQSRMKKNAFKRALHIVSENQRTMDAAQALIEEDFSTLRDLMYASHESMRHDFEITVAQTDYLVEIIRQESGESGAARMTGGGFGGAIVAFLRPDVVERVRLAIGERYSREFALTPAIYQCNAGPGMHQIECR
jgi:galactokinase